MKKIITLTIIVAFLHSTTYAFALEHIQERGHINCGVKTDLTGLSTMDKKNKWSGLYVDYCRALAAGVLGDANKVNFVLVTDKTSLKALKTGSIDILSTDTTFSLSIDTQREVNFAGIIYYGGQGLLIRKKLNIHNIKDLNNASICIQAGSKTKPMLDKYFFKHRIKYKPKFYDSLNEAKLGFMKNKCDVFVDTQYYLYRMKSHLKNSFEYTILPQIIAKEPKGAIIREKDDQWFNIVRWTLFALIKAEELGITKTNIDVKKLSTNPHIQIFLGIKEDGGKNINLDKNWAYNIIKQVGNYGEIFENNLGINSDLKMDRGYNNIWQKGGLMYAMP